MAFARPVLIVFHGPAGEGEAEQLVARARVAAAKRTIAAALAAGFEAVIVASAEPEAFEPAPPGVLLDADAPGEAFSFETRLRGLIARHGLQRPAVMGAGAVPLLGVAEFRLVAEQLEARDGRFVTNNFFSSDLAAWTPGDALDRVRDIPRDNVLPRRLRDQAGLAPVVLARTTESQFDLDTPADVTVLNLVDGLAAELAGAVADPRLPIEPYQKLMRLFCDRDAEVVLAGRVGSATWQHMERETACRVRVFSEERGLATSPGTRSPRSALGFLLEDVGAERFFARMAEMGDGLVLDTRVLEAHLGITPSREDRFQSDLLAPANIAHPALRALTAAAAAAPIPVLLGGHSLVSGGLMALNDAAWRENDRLQG